ncbi:MAG: hypothetical protein HQL16_06670, partial [Candidatus Omnitrophica bacterium]|nr:hypothetical protein [Candidatus Omnitrophota bacterium]
MRKILSLLIVFSLIFVQIPLAYPQDLSWLPLPGTMVSPGEAFRPSLFRGIKIDNQDPLHFQFLMEAGQSALRKEESSRSLRYFLTALTVPGKDIWVNLSPVESSRISADVLADTEMGRDLLGQDYVLKQLA